MAERICTVDTPSRRCHTTRAYERDAPVLSDRSTEMLRASERHRCCERAGESGRCLQWTRNEIQRFGDVEAQLEAVAGGRRKGGRQGRRLATDCGSSSTSNARQTTPKASIGIVLMPRRGRQLRDPNPEAVPVMRRLDIYLR